MSAQAVSHPQQSTYHPQPVRHIRILLVDDQFLVRQGLRKCLSHHFDIEVVGEAADGEEAVMMADQLKPDVVLMDIHMPRMDGIKATGSIMRAHPRLVIIGLSFDMRKRNREAMLQAGARLLLDKGAAREQLYHAIHEAVGTSMDTRSSGDATVA